MEEGVGGSLAVLWIRICKDMKLSARSDNTLWIRIWPKIKDNYGVQYKNCFENYVTINEQIHNLRKVLFACNVRYCTKIFPFSVGSGSENDETYDREHLNIRYLWGQPRAGTRSWTSPRVWPRKPRRRWRWWTWGSWCTRARTRRSAASDSRWNWSGSSPCPRRGPGTGQSLIFSPCSWRRLVKERARSLYTQATLLLSQHTVYCTVGINSARRHGRADGSAFSLPKLIIRKENTWMEENLFPFPVQHSSTLRYTYFDVPVFSTS